MIIIGGLGSVLGSIFGAIFVTLLPIGIRYAMEAFGGGLLLPADRAQPDPQPPSHAVRRAHHPVLVVEPDGLNRLWRNIRNYFRVWPFAY